MGITSLILGIIAIILSVIPEICIINIILFLVGTVFGIADISSNTKTKGIAVTGIILSILAFLITLTTIGIHNGSNTVKTSSKASSTITQQDKIKVYNLGEAVKVDNWEITVLGSEDKKVLKNSYGKKTTENNYIVVKLKIKNLSNEPNTLLTSESKLTSSSYEIYSRSKLELYDGKSTYIADYHLEDYVDNDFDIFFNKVNPNTAVTYYAVFETDLPSTQKEYKLKLNDNSKIFLKIK